MTAYTGHSCLKILVCVCATSVPSECLFSKAGYIAGNLRARLSPINANRLFFCQETRHNVF